MIARWSLADLIDLEFFWQKDQDLIDSQNADRLRARDRQIYLSIRDACRQKDLLGRERCLLRQWLSQRRQMFLSSGEGGGVLPGGLFDELIRICNWALSLFTLAAGWGLAMSFLSYSGTIPINVTSYFALFVGLQLLLLFVLLIFTMVHRLSAHTPLPVTFIFLRKMVFYLAAKLGRFSSVGQFHRLYACFFTKLQGKRRVYGVLPLLPFFSLMQRGGIGFNLGVLAATLAKIVGTDIAFGWQSSLQISAETVFQCVRILALPWSWAFPSGVAYPDLLQIKGSQMFLKEGIYHLATTDLVSWWPFLSLSVLVYALIPRILLLLISYLVEKRGLAELDFSTALPQQTIQRMLTPRLQTEAAEVLTVEREETVEKTTSEPLPEEVDQAPSRHVLALVPDELYEDCPEDALASLVQQQLGRHLKRCFRIDLGSADTQSLLQNIGSQLEARTDAVMLLQEAWQPPIEEFVSFLRQLREVVGEKIPITLIFIGKPVAETIFTKVRAQDYSIWQQKIESLGDPWLHCVQLEVA